MFDPVEQQRRQREEARLERDLNRQLFDHHVETADAYARRHQQPEESARFGELFTDPTTGEIRSYTSLIDPALQVASQMEAPLTHYAERARHRQMLADKIERDVVPLLPLPWVAKIPDKLRNARRTGTFGLNLRSGRGIVLWDEKASLSRLCPDDAREEAKRLEKRYTPAIEQAWAEGCHLQYAVFTMPNFKRGELAKGMKKIFDRFRALIKRKDADGNLVFPEIQGALCVLEAPLGASRDWNVHLNVYLVVKGFCDYRKLRDLWHWNVYFKKLPTGDLEALKASFRELIKYGVQTTGEKSEHHAARDSTRDSSVEWEEGVLPVDDGSAPSNRAAAPPMLAWTGDELGEWLMAMRGFRRTRSYGSLFGAPKVVPEELADVVWLGSVRLRGGMYALRLRLLDSIPEDKSGSSSALERWKKYLARVKPPPEPGAAPLNPVLTPFENLIG
jgi:hypothetical protein